MVEPITIFIIAELEPSLITGEAYEIISAYVKKLLGRPELKSPRDLLFINLKKAVYESRKELSLAYYDVAMRYLKKITKSIEEECEKEVKNLEDIHTDTFTKLLKNEFGKLLCNFSDYEITVIKTNLWKFLVLEDEFFKPYVVTNLISVERKSTESQKNLNELIDRINRYPVIQKSEKHLAFIGIYQTALISIGAAFLSLGGSIVFLTLPLLNQFIQKPGTDKDLQLINFLNLSAAYFMWGSLILIGLAVLGAYIAIYKRK